MHTNIPYAGSKRGHGVLDVLRAATPKTFDIYYEPFVGSCAAYLALREDSTWRPRSIVLGDIDADLIRMYQDIVKNPSGVYQRMLKHARFTLGHESAADRKKAWLSTRGLWNSGADKHSGTQLYLRLTAYNGLFRRNLRGELNVPMGTRGHRLELTSLDQLKALAEALRPVHWLVGDYLTQAQQVFVGPGSLVYLDPPYAGTQYQYPPFKFTAQDHSALVEQAKEWTQLGAKVVLSNSGVGVLQEGAVNVQWPQSRLQAVDHRWRVGGGSRQHAATETVRVGQPQEAPR